MKKILSNGVLKSNSSETFDTFEQCLCGKMTKTPFPIVGDMVDDILGLIHADVCGSFRSMIRSGKLYFVTFTFDYSRCGYVYLLKHKREIFKNFKACKREVENQLGKTIKALQSDRNEEYMIWEFCSISSRDVAVVVVVDVDCDVAGVVVVDCGRDGGDEMRWWWGWLWWCVAAVVVEMKVVRVASVGDGGEGGVDWWRWSWW
ncbi:putative RNA-directed DNA polymerase [Tanacetum coccineum]|uniref:RNA-directed DNA polymerase n=1 Tax=Tanacetum coccineum TaxID=301880 RepID=A0ABQ5G7F6_9ASTR